MGPVLHRQHGQSGRAEKHREKPVPGWLGFLALKVVRGEIII